MNFLTKIQLSISQMLHGCRSDLMLTYLVNSKKDRNLYLYLLVKILNQQLNIVSDIFTDITKKIFYKNVEHKWRLNRYDFYTNGFKCNILVITKSCEIFKISANLQKLPNVRIISIETHKYEARINSNDM